MKKNQNILISFFIRHHRFGIYLLIVILFNIVGVRLFKHVRVDITRNNSYSISKVSKEIVSSLADPIRIKVFFSKNLPAPYDGTERYLRDLLSEYGLYANRHFNYTFYDCSEGKENTPEKIKQNIKTANDFGIYSVNVQSVEKDEVKVVKAYMGVVVQHGDMIERIPAVESTAGLEYRMTSIMQNMINKISALQSIKGKVQVKLYLPETFKIVAPFVPIQGLESIPEKVEEAIEKSMERNFNKLEYVHVKDNPNEAMLEEINALRLLSLEWKNFNSPTTGQAIPGGKGFAAIVTRYGDRTEKYELLSAQPTLRMTPAGLQAVDSYHVSDLENLDESINAMVDKLLEINDDVAYLDAKGTVSTTSGGNNPFAGRLGLPNQEKAEGQHFVDFIEKTYKLQRVDLKNLANVPGVLIIAGAKEEFNDTELFQVDQHLMQGKPLIILTSGIKEEDSEQNKLARQFGQFNPPTYSALKTGLEKLLKHYGVEVKNKIVMDKQSYVERRRDSFGAGMAEPRNIHHILKLSRDQINKDFDVLENIKEIYLISSSPLIIDEENLSTKNIKATPLFHSSRNAWEADNLQFGNIPPANEEMGQYVTGYVLEGEFESYFAQSGVPASEDETEESGAAAKSASGNSAIEGQNTFIKKGKAAKLMVISTEEVIKNTVIDAQGQTPNAVAILNLIDHMANRSEWARMRSKTQSHNPIDPYDPQAFFISRILTNRQYIKAFNIVGLPLIIAVSGLMIYQRRKTRRDKISKQFI